MRTLTATLSILFLVSAGCAAGKGGRVLEERREGYLRKCLDIAAENIANSDTNADVNGLNNPYRRKVVRWHEASRTWSVIEVVSPFPKRYEPGHPLADAAGFVRYPNVIISQEAAEAEAAAQKLQRMRPARPGT